MTEKQYTYLNASKCKSIGSFFCNGIILTNEEVVDLLNENEQLKTLNIHLKNESSWIRDYAYWKEKDAFNKLFGAYMETCEEYRILVKENEQLKQSIKEIDEAELHLKQIILKRIDDYIWEWEDEGTPVAQVLRELRDEIKGDVE